MSVKNFENNGKKISENIVKLKLEQNIKSLLYNHLVYMYAEKTDNTENPLQHSSQPRVIIDSA